jgi:hypothetical protein
MFSFGQKDRSLVFLLCESCSGKKISYFHCYTWRTLVFFFSMIIFLASMVFPDHDALS